VEEINLTPKLKFQHHFVYWFVTSVVKLYYPNVKVYGKEYIPTANQPVIYVLNHPNFLLDRLMLTYSQSRKRIACMGKSTFFSHPIARLAMETFGALPVYRKKDDGLPYGPQGDAAERNQRILAHCRSLLHEGSCFALFPEGTTHSEDRLLPLQVGAVRIALEAEAQANWCGDIQITPVGLGYENKTKFGSTVRVVYGAPIKAKQYRTLYESNPQNAEQVATQHVTEQLKQLREFARDVVPETPTLGLGQMMWLFVCMILLSPIALIGLLMNAVPYFWAEPLSNRFFDKRDTRTATGKMLASLILLPLVWLVSSLAVGSTMNRFYGLLFLLITPFISYLTMRWTVWGRQLVKHLLSNNPTVVNTMR